MKGGSRCVSRITGLQICDQQWNEEDAEVACRQLGHSGGNVNIIPAWLLKNINIAARRKSGSIK